MSIGNRDMNSTLLKVETQLKVDELESIINTKNMNKKFSLQKLTSGLQEEPSLYLDQNQLMKEFGVSPRELGRGTNAICYKKLSKQVVAKSHRHIELSKYEEAKQKIINKIKHQHMNETRQKELIEIMDKYTEPFEKRVDRSHKRNMTVGL